MSATNWADCPQCKLNAAAHQQACMKNAKRSYGKVSAEDYAELLTLAQIAPAVDDGTLREDYEIGIGDDLKFYVRYRANCETCGLLFEHKDTYSAPPPRKRDN